MSRLYLVEHKMIGAIFYDNKLLKEMKKYYNIEGEKVLLKF